MAKKSLFIEANWYNPTLLRQHLEHVRLYHKDPSRDDYIHNVVVNQIGRENGTLASNMAIIAPYMPGGDRKTFDNAFIGSTIIKADRPYSVGMTDPSHRWRSLNAQKRLWLSFKTQYPHIDWHPYLEHEGVLDYFTSESIRQGYEAYLIQSIRDARIVHGGKSRAFLWSPAIWSGRPLTWRQRRAIKKTFRNVQSWTGGRFWLHLQDMMGRGRADITKEDVRTWYRQLNAMRCFASLRVNMEMFTTRPGYYGSGDPAEVQAREAWYAAQGMPLGASWEMRFWMDTHAER